MLRPSPYFLRSCETNGCTSIPGLVRLSYCYWSRVWSASSRLKQPRARLGRLYVILYGLYGWYTTDMLWLYRAYMYYYSCLPRCSVVWGEEGKHAERIFQEGVNQFYIFCVRLTIASFVHNYLIHLFCRNLATFSTRQIRQAKKWRNVMYSVTPNRQC